MDEPAANPLLEDAARQLGVVLDAVHTGALTADGPAASALVKRLEGALIALQVLDEQEATQGVDLHG